MHLFCIRPPSVTAAIFVRVREKQGQRKERGTCLQSGRRRGNKKEGADNRPRKAKGKPGKEGTQNRERRQEKLRGSNKRSRPELKKVLACDFAGANDRTRTGDLRITSALLYQLSHVG